MIIFITLIELRVLHFVLLIFGFRGPPNGGAGRLLAPKRLFRCTYVLTLAHSVPRDEGVAVAYFPSAKAAEPLVFHGLVRPLAVVEDELLPVVHFGAHFLQHFHADGHAALDPTPHAGCCVA